MSEDISPLAFRAEQRELSSPRAMALETLAGYLGVCCVPGTILGSEGTVGTQKKPNMNRTDRQYSRRR